MCRNTFLTFLRFVVFVVVFNEYNADLICKVSSEFMVLR